jgi:hypothetical protein
VNEPKRGFHKRPVAVLDWKSLYPSIMMSHNLCHSTWVSDETLFGVPGVAEHRISDDFVAHFASSEMHRGVLPQILEELQQERTNAKGLMKKHAKLAKDASVGVPAARHHAMMVKVYDGRQLAIKVASNSIYGACGASVDAGAKYPCLAISATVTLEGRKAMVVKKELLPKHFPGIEVIYGDSVTGDTPLLLKLPTGAIFVTTFAQLVQDRAWTAYDNFKRDEPERTHKQQALMPGVLVWACDRWTPVVRAIRHKTHKRIVRVLTHTGLVDCTEDHSLLTPGGTPIKPAD